MTSVSYMFEKKLSLTDWDTCMTCLALVPEF